MVACTIASGDQIFGFCLCDVGEEVGLVSFFKRRLERHISKREWHDSCGF